MPVRIRLRRVGRKKQPSYRIVVAESSTPRGGVYLDNVGFYNPRQDPIELRIDLTKVDEWVEKGATLTPTVDSLVRRVRQGELPADTMTPEAASEPAGSPKAAEGAPTPEGEAAPAAGAEAEQAAAE